MVVSARPARALTSGAARWRRGGAGRARSSFARGIALSFFEEFDLDDGPQTEEHPPASGRGRRGGLGGGGGRARHAADPSRRRRRRARAGAGVRRAGLVRRHVQGRPVPLVRAGRELRRPPVQQRRQGARRRALQPGADAHAADGEGRDVHPARERRRDDGRCAQAGRQDQAAGAAALPAAGPAVPHARPAGPAGRAQDDVQRGRPRHARDREPAQGDRRRLRRADRLRRRLRGQLPAPGAATAEGRQRHGRAHHGVGLGHLPRAREPVARTATGSGSSRCAAQARRRRARAA